METVHLELKVGNYLISDNRDLLDFEIIWRFLRSSYWVPGIDLDEVKFAASHSIPFGVYDQGNAGSNSQVGYARILSDRSSIAYVLDVFIVQEHRGKGLSRALMNFILAYPAFARVRTWLLSTREAHGLYTKLGFGPLPEPDRYMRKTVPRET